jgi:hypothetical protein
MMNIIVISWVAVILATSITQWLCNRINDLRMEKIINDVEI